MHLTAPSDWPRSIGTGGRDPSERVVTIAGMRRFVHALTLYLSEREIEDNSSQIDIARRASEAAERAAVEATRASSAAERQAVAAERQATAAERANARATIALVIAILSIIISAKDIWLPYLRALL
jgi:hypothetical protein